MKKKKVSIFIHSFSGGGAERVVSIILNQLNEVFEFYIVLMDNTIKYNIPKDIPILFIKNSKNSKYLKILKLPLFAYRYYKILKKYKIDISLSFLYIPNLINILSKKIFNIKSRIIVSERSNILFQPMPIKILVKYLYRHADLVISNSKGAKEVLISEYFVDGNKIKTINNPITIPKIVSKKPNKDFFSFISVGRFKKVKNYELLIKAFSKIKSITPIKLFLIGEGEEEIKLKALTKELNVEDRVVFPGFVKNIGDFYRKSDCFVLTSKHEGFPNVILEALNYGLPVISTNCKFGPKEILSNKEFSVYDSIKNISMEEYGVLVKNNDVESLKEAMELMIINDDIRNNYRNKARVRGNHFKTESIIPQFEDAINGIFDKKTSF